VSSAFFVRFLLRHTRAILGVALALVIVAGVRTGLTYGNLRSDLEQLLPAHAPGVTALNEARQRLPGLRHLGVVVDTGGSDKAPAALRFIDDLERKARAYPAGLVAGLRSGVAEERRFVETHALQLMDPDDVRLLRESVDARRRWEIGRATGLSLLTEDEDPAPEVPVQALVDKYRARAGHAATFPGDRFVSADGRTAVLVLQAGAHATSLAGDEALLDRVRDDIESLGFPSAYAAGMRVGFAGDIASRTEEARGLMMDLGISGLLVLALVGGVIAWFYRSLAAIPVLGLPAVAGTLYTFGLAALPPLSIRELNSNTAFLSSIVIGNGINSGIILLSRFREEAQRGGSRDLALVTAVRETWRPTLFAAAAAAGAYGSLLAADFRGFKQFGWIGALGMLVCWATTYVLVPPLVHVLTRQFRAPQPTPRPSISARVASVVVERPGWVLGSAALLLALSLTAIVGRSSDWLETDFSRLRRADSFVDGERYWGKRMDATLRTYLTPVAILTGSPEAATRVARAVRELEQSHRAGDLIASVRTSEDVLPSTRHAALVEAQKLRQALTPTLLGALSEPDRLKVEQLVSDEALRPLTANDVPAALVAGLRDRSGHIDRNVLVFPKLGVGTWDAGRMAELTADLRHSAATDPGRTVVVGSLLLSSDIIEALRRDGPITISVSMAIVLAIALLAFRSFRLSLAAVFSLVCGVVLMLGVSAALGERLNFSNLIALPITFGIGADYSINVLKRLQADGDVHKAVANTGGAVALCSAMTVIGFGSLLVAQNRALSSFGALAIAGELACLTTAVLIVSAYFAWRSRKSGDSAFSAVRQGEAAT
jgi:predicted RND superfamily exporter protein